MANTYMNVQDAPSAKEATVFCTIGNRRYALLNAKNCEATASVDLVDVPRLGSRITGKKVNGMEIKLTMEVYKCTEMFDEIITEYKDTGYLPTFDVQVTSEDKATCMGRTTKIYNDCVLSGDVLLSMFDAEGDLITQEIECYAMDYSSPEKYTNPSYM